MGWGVLLPHASLILVLLPRLHFFLMLADVVWLWLSASVSFAHLFLVLLDFVLLRLCSGSSWYGIVAWRYPPSPLFHRFPPRFQRVVDLACIPHPNSSLARIRIRNK